MKYRKIMTDTIDSLEKLRDFINSRKNKHVQANFQPVVIQTLLEKNGIASKEDTDEALIERNDEFDEDETPQTPVYEVLEEAKVIEPVKDNVVSLYYKNPSDEAKKELVTSCEEWINNAIDGVAKLEKLVKQFNENRKCFDPHRLEINEIEELRRRFIENFSKEKIVQMKIDEYVDGIINTETGQRKTDTFCSTIYSNMKPFGSIIMPAGKAIFGVWMKTKTQSYDYRKVRFQSTEDALEQIKKFILELLNAGEKFDLEAIRKNKLQRFFRSKILCIYFPDIFIQIHSQNAVERLVLMLHIFSKEEIKEKNFFELRQAILKFKQENELLKNLNIYDFSHVLWHFYKKSKKRKTEVNDEIFDELEQFEDHDVPKTQIQVLNKFYKKVGKDLPSYKIFGIRKKDEKSALLPDSDVDSPHYMHNLVKGVYKPEKSNFAQSIMLNPKSRWQLEILRDYPTLKIRYDFEDPDVYSNDISYLKKCMEIDLPIGIFFRLKRDKYKCLGLGKIISHEGTVFEIESYGISEKESKELKEKSLKEYDAITQDPDVAKIEYVDYSKLFTEVDFQQQYSTDLMIESFQGEPHKSRIPKIIDLCESGDWVVPDFQRFFDWDKKMVKNFLNSIFHGYYVGSLLLWENLTEKEIGVTAIKGVDKNSENLRTDNIVLDGQQRLTSLYYAIKSPDYYLKGEKERSFFYIDFGEFFSTKKPEEVIKEFSKEIDPEDCFTKLLFPFNKLLSFKGWIKDLRNFLDENYSSLDLKKQILPLCDAIDQKLDYIKEKFEIPYISLEKISLSDVVEIFKRINTTGKPLDSFDLLIAILSKHKVELRKLWEKACKIYPKINEYFENTKGGTKGLYVLQSMALSEYSKSKSCKNEDVQKIFKNTASDRQDFIKRWSEALDYTNQAINHFEDIGTDGFGVIHRKWLPFEPMIPVLSSLLRFIKEKKSISEKEAYEKIAFWYWISVFSNAYSQSVDAKKTSDYNAMTDWIEKNVVPPEFIRFRNNFDSNLNLNNVENKRSSIFRGVLSLLALIGAKDWAVNRAVLNQSTFKQNDVQVDHIFPKSKYKDDPYNESILNKTWLAKETNEWMKKAKEPATYLNETILQNFNNDKEEFKKTLQTHMINEHAYIALLQNNSEQFVLEREKEILKEIAKRIGSDKTQFESSFVIQSTEQSITTENIEEILKKDESLTLEFKSTLKFDLRENKPNKDRINDILRSITGFMNRGGGTLIVGYDDDNKKMIGLEIDYPHVGKKEWDSWKNTLIQSCAANLGDTITNLYLEEPMKVEHEGKDLAKIVVKQSNEPVYLNDIFYLRFPGQTRDLKGKELDDYKKTRFEM